MKQKIIEYLMYIIFAIILLGTLTFGLICYNFISVINNGQMCNQIAEWTKGKINEENKD